MRISPVRLGACALLAAAGGAAGCSFAPSGEVVGDDDAGGGEDGGQRVTLRDDTAADFAGAGAVTDGVVIEPWGALAPAAYHVGGLIAHGANDQRFTTPEVTTWAMVTAAAPAGTGLWTRPLAGDPVGVGLTSGDTWTYWAEGEVLLDAGDTSFLVDADDAGFLEIAAPGGDFVRVVNARQGLGQGTFTAAAAGWHRIRLAVVEGVGGSRFDVQLYVGASAVAEPLASPRLRTRVDLMRGTFIDGWDSSLLQGTPQHSLSAAGLIDASFGNGVPTALGIGSGDFWSLRWSGQFYVTMPGRYRMRIESDDGHRLYVGGQLVSDVLVGGTRDQTAEVDLVTGWNDLVLDLNENTGDANIRLRVVEGPEPGLDGVLPASRLRPLAPRSERLETVGDDTDHGVPDNNPAGAQSTVRVGGLDGATVASVDVIAGVNHGRFADLQIRLVHPGGNQVLLRNNSDDGGSGGRSLRFTTEAFDDTPAAGTWTLLVTDTAPGNSGTITDFQLAVHLAGGSEQVARTASYTSEARDLGDGVLGVDTVRYAVRAPAGAGVTVRLRSCGAPEQCASAPWSAPIGDGAAAGVPAARYVQYRVDLTSDGSREAELDWLELDYRVPAT